MTSVAAGVNAETINHTYDELDLLLSVPAIGESFTYNQIGNLTSHNGVALTYPASGGAAGSRPHVVASFNGTSYSSEANG